MEESAGIYEFIRRAGSVNEALGTMRNRLSVHVTYHLARTIPEVADAPYVKSTYPAQWIARYLIAGYVRFDPVALAGFERMLPFDWAEIDVGAEAAEMMRDAEAHGIGPSGYSIPIIDRHGRRALFSICSHLRGGDWKVFLARHLDEVIEAAHFVHRLATAEIYGTAEPPHLTTREREVLTWTARGKDYKAIAVIVGISPHTTKAYLKSARYKLDCSTLAQAVAKAINLRIITL